MFGEKSRFACLKVYDDSSSSSNDDEEKQAKKNKNKQQGPGKSGSVKKAPGGLIVHNVIPKPKNRGKKNKKAPTIEENGIPVQDTPNDHIERKYHEDLRQALKLSVEAASASPPEPEAPAAPTPPAAPEPPKTPAKLDQKEIQPLPVKNQKDYVEEVLMDIDAMALPMYSITDKARLGREEALVALYRTKLVETLRELSLQKANGLKAEAEATKYRSRYRKMCELLKDAEVNEKAHLTAQLEKSRKAEVEMGEQIAALMGELEQARTKIREIEKRKRV